MPVNLSRQILKSGAPPAGDSNEGVWIEVIRKMDEVYADLLHYQVELEEKNVALEQAQQFIRGVLTSMTDVLIVCDLNGLIQQGNRAMSELNGQSEEGLIGASIFSLFDQESVATIEHALVSVRAGESEEHEVSILDNSGHGSPLVIRCSPQFNHEGVLLGMVLIGRPVGELHRAYNELNHTHKELQQAQQHLVQSEKMASLGRLVAGVAHELNNPISFVHSNMYAIKKYGYRLREYIESLHERLGNQSDNALRQELKIDRILDDIPSLVDGGLEGTERVSRIVSDLRRFSASHREAESEFDLLAIVRNAAGWVVQAAQLQAPLNITGQSLLVTNYEGFIHQVIVNLVQNGLDAMEGCENPKIDIRCWQDGDNARVEVRDYGAGITDADLIRIFDPFFTTKEIGKGTGLGLYVSYGLIVEQCGGQLDAANHAQGGAVFTLTLPLSRGDHLA
jgi:two-component system sensor histidine kinase HupT/HoxJ